MLWQSAGLEILGEPECWELLESHDFGRLAVSVRNNPDIFPVNYIVDERSILFRTDPGLKLAAAVAGESVAFEIDDYDRDRGIGWSVVVTGTTQEVHKMEDRARVEELALEAAVPGRKNRYVRIRPLSVSGRRVPQATS